MSHTHSDAPQAGRWPPAKLSPATRRRLALGAAILLALLLRLLRLGFQPLWWDEGWSVYFATTALGDMVRLTAVDIHPPLYYALLHLWTALLGASPLALRLFSVLAGAAAVPLVYLAGRRLAGVRVGLLAAFLLALSPFAVCYSQEVRMYGLVTTLGLAAFWLALTMEGVAWRPLPWAGYVVLGAAALYTQYYAAFLLLALNVAILARWLARRRPLRAWLPWLGAQAAILLLFLPWLLYAGSKLLTYVHYKVGVEEDAPIPFPGYLARHLAAFDWGHAEGGLAGRWWLGLIPLAILGACLLASTGLKARRREGNASGRTVRRGAADGPALVCGLCGPIVVILVLGGFVVNLFLPFIAPRIERQLLLALPYYLLLVAGALHTLGERRTWPAAVAFASFLAAAVVSLAFFYTVPRYPGDDYRPVAAKIASLARPTDALVAVHPWQVGYFASYLPADRRPALVLSPREVVPEERQYWADDPGRMAADLDRLLAESGRLWLPAHQSMGRVLEDRLDTYLVEHAYPVLTEWYGDTTVLTLFSAGQTDLRPAATRFGDWLWLAGAGTGAEPVEAGWGVVAVDLSWKLAALPDSSYTVGLRLADAAGRIWAQRDSEPQGGRGSFAVWPLGEPRPDHLGLLVPAGTPPGDYRLSLQVYRTADLAPLPATVDGRTTSHVELAAAVRVVRPEAPPAVEAMAIGSRREEKFGPLRLLGYTLHTASDRQPGDSVEVDLFWQALGAPGEDYLPRLQLRDEAGDVRAELVEKPVGGTYPTAWWADGELVRDPHALAVPAATPQGRYRLTLELVRAADGRPVSLGAGRSAIELAELTVLGREHNYSAPAPQHVQHELLGSSVELAGYDLEAMQAPGAAVPLTLYWHALATPDRGYRSFVHLLDARGEIVAQDDGVPGRGDLPAPGWLPGEYLADPRTLQLPSSLPAGDYAIEAGLYDPVTGLRLGERVLLETTLRVTASAP